MLLDQFVQVCIWQEKATVIKTSQMKQPMFWQQTVILLTPAVVS